MYALRSENLTLLGGPMGTERTFTNWVKYFKSLAAAKKYAEADYVKNRGTESVKWKSSSKGWWTNDLLFVMYHITKIVPED